MKFPHLKAIRQQRKIKRTDLAKATDLEYWKLEGLERGRDVHLTPSEIARLAKVIPDVTTPGGFDSERGGPIIVFTGRWQFNPRTGVLLPLDDDSYLMVNGGSPQNRPLSLKKA